jgi:hypothetical protein
MAGSPSEGAAGLALRKARPSSCKATTSSLRKSKPNPKHPMIQSQVLTSPLDRPGFIAHVMKKGDFTMPAKIKYWTGAFLAIFLTANSARAVLSGNYPAVFSELSALIDSDELDPGQMMRGGWLATRYFSAAAEGLKFNQERFVVAQTAGSAGLSGLFLAVHGTQTHHQFVCKTLETDKTKRILMSRIFGTKEAFFQSLENGEQLSPLLETLPSTDRLRLLLRMLIQSKDPLTRRAGLFWGYWLRDGDYWKSTREMTAKDPDPVNRACALRLIKGSR